MIVRASVRRQPLLRMLISSSSCPSHMAPGLVDHGRRPRSLWDGPAQRRRPAGSMIRPSCQLIEVRSATTSVAPVGTAPVRHPPPTRPPPPAPRGSGGAVLQHDRVGGCNAEASQRKEVSLRVWLAPGDEVHRDQHGRRCDPGRSEAGGCERRVRRRHHGPAVRRQARGERLRARGSPRRSPRHPARSRRCDRARPSGERHRRTSRPWSPMAGRAPRR